MIGVNPMLIVLFLACSGKIADSSDQTMLIYTGEELVERFNRATCHLLVEPECVENLTECNAPVNLFGDWTDCMNSQNLNFTHCSNIPYLFEQNQQLALNCIEILEAATCDAADLCIEGEYILRYQECSALNDLVVNNCNPF